jgi:23S rRNA pseudouridine1911/1915/1917 synthase
MSKENLFELEIIATDNQYKRLDTFLNSKIDSLSRTQIKRLFEAGQITSETKLELKRMPKPGTKITVNIPEAVDSNIEPENIPLDILFEDEYLIIINKPAGLVVHPAPGNYTGTLVNAILYHCNDIKGIGGEKRPGIVHRLDKGTTGVMVVAKEQKCHEGLVELFSTHDIERYYEAICVGSRIQPEGTIETTIGRNPKNRLKMKSNIPGKNAITHYKVLSFFERLSHLELKLETGRTHQIRVHLSEVLNCPILRDPLYATPLNQLKVCPDKLKPILKNYEHPLLHAKVLGFVHPITKEKLRFEVEPPSPFKECLEMLNE